MAESNSTGVRFRAKDETGKIYGKLTVIEYSHTKISLFWKCQCQCGNVTIVNGQDLRSGKSRSCSAGCGMTTHGMRGTHEFQCWSDMKKRCYDETAKNFKDYGGRGIRVCRGWHTSINFFADMGRKPIGHRLSINRINNDGHYSCGHCDECKENGWTMNCKWATSLEQMSHYRKTQNITFNGKTQCVRAWARELGIHPNTIYNRLKKGWSSEQCLVYPTHGETQLVAPLSAS